MMPPPPPPPQQQQQQQQDGEAAAALSKALRSKKVLSFDIIGTVLDWQAGFYPCFLPLIQQLDPASPLTEPFPTQPAPGSRLAPVHPIFRAFATHESRLHAELPRGDHATLLGFALRDLGTQLGVRVSDADAEAASRSVGTWSAFPDSVAALQRLAKHYKLVALSNANNAALKDVILKAPGGALAEVPFAAAYTAQDIGAFKPALDNFEYLLDGVRRDLGVADPTRDLLHVAHGVATDMLPAAALDLDHVWVERGTDNWPDNTSPRKKEFSEQDRLIAAVPDLKTLADAADAAWASSPSPSTQANGAT